MTPTKITIRIPNIERMIIPRNFPKETSWIVISPNTNIITVYIKNAVAIISINATSDNDT